MTDYIKIMSKRHDGRNWSISGNDYETLTMLDGGEKPTKASLDAQWESVQAELAAETTDADTARASAMAKLAGLGLTADEIAALVGG